MIAGHLILANILLALAVRCYIGRSSGVCLFAALKVLVCGSPAYGVLRCFLSLIHWNSVQYRRVLHGFRFQYQKFTIMTLNLNFNLERVFQAGAFRTEFASSYKTEWRNKCVAEAAGPVVALISDAVSPRGAKNSRPASEAVANKERPWVGTFGYLQLVWWEHFCVAAAAALGQARGVGGSINGSPEEAAGKISRPRDHFGRAHRRLSHSFRADRRVGCRWVSLQLTGKKNRQW